MHASSNQVTVGHTVRRCPQPDDTGAAEFSGGDTSFGATDGWGTADNSWDAPATSWDTPATGTDQPDVSW